MYGGTITSCPGPTPQAMSEASSADEHELVPSAYRQRIGRKQTKELFCKKSCYDLWKTRKVI